MSHFVGQAAEEPELVYFIIFIRRAQHSGDQAVIAIEEGERAHSRSVR
jgi:hypothetical protein